VGIGHVAVGLGLKSAYRPTNVGVWVFSAFLADFLLGWFVFVRWESYEYPADYESVHYMLFTFPWSHGLLPLISYAALLAWLFRRDMRVALLVSLAVVSHFLLDGIVHVKGLPVWGPGSWELGVGLWRRFPLALEAAMALGALILYWRATSDRARPWRIAMSIYVIFLAAVMLLGQLTAKQQTRTALIVSWVVAPVVFSCIAGLLDRKVEGSGAHSGSITSLLS
jgi:hypothetical protein